MGAVTGTQAKIRYTSAVATTANAEAFVSVSPTTDYYEYRIVNAAKRHWDRDVEPQVYVGGSTVDPAINYVQGKVTFTAAQTTAAVITADLSYVTASYLPWTRSFSLDVDNAVYDVTSFSTSTGDVQWRSYVGGLSDWTADLGGIVPSGPATTGYQPLWYDLINTDTDLIVEFHMASTYKFEGYATVASDAYTADIDALQEETVTLRSASALYYATTE